MGLFGPPDVARLEAAGKIDDLVKAARYKKDPEVAAAAREALGRHVDKLIQRLQTKNLVQLRTAREALVLAGPPARERLLFILREGHVHRRQDAAFVLGEMRDREAVPTLCMAMNNPDPLLRYVIVGALAKIGGNEARDTIELALKDPDEGVAREAAKVLAKSRR